jgi:hypothetical protein
LSSALTTSPDFLFSKYAFISKAVCQSFFKRGIFLFVSRGFVSSVTIRLLFVSFKVKGQQENFNKPLSMLIKIFLLALYFKRYKKQAKTNS